jgi:hypothetical protein
MRRGMDFTRPPSAETGLGADPWTIRRVASGWVGILRGRSAVVLLDDDLREVARAPAPRSPTGIAVAPNGDVVVTGELSAAIARFAVRGRTLAPLGELRVDGVRGLRDVAVAPNGTVWVTDERGARLLSIGRGGAIDKSIPVGHTPAQVIATSKHVVVDAVTEHTLVVVDPEKTDAEPVRIRHDGPMWGFDARETPSGLVIVAGGVEDHPLDRRSGFFGYIDSFVFAYRVHDGVAERIAEVNVAAAGVVTPKALALDGDDRAIVLPYGSDTGLRLDLKTGKSTPIAVVPGVRAMAQSGRAIAMADPLLDAWLLANERGLRVVPVAGETPRPTPSRLGEALFFTSLMAPSNASTGAHSRFTCETCHFEGYVDGRTHHTGREDIHATTKPLVGLVGNRPYFSRALDPDLSTIAHAEFRVAGAGNDVDPFVDLEPRDHPWVSHLGVVGPVSALDLRRALMRFLVDFSHRPNPATLGKTALSPLEHAGEALFRDRCESCHTARLSADDPSTRVPFERWEPLVLAEAAPIVWGSTGYQKTGIEPYVHPSGTRTPSLRRLYKKYPYFTNGSAKSLGDVLDRARFGGGRFFHDEGPAGSEPLGDQDKRALAAFLELL